MYMYYFRCLQDKYIETSQSSRKDLEGVDDNHHQENYLNQQHKELGDDLGQNQLRDVDPRHPCTVNQTLLPLDYKGQCGEANGDSKRHTKNIP